MIRIPTGTIPANTARCVSIAFGLASLAAARLLPQYSPLFDTIGKVLTALGITLGNAATAPVNGSQVQVPK
jgi:hypothetical protein